MNPIALVTLALALWGWLTPINVNVVERPADPGIAVTIATVPGQQCTIILGANYYQASPSLQREIITHEVGHCLGLGHQPQTANSIMVPALNGLVSPAPLDFESLKLIWPLYHPPLAWHAYAVGIVR